MRIPYASLLLGPAALFAVGFTLNALVMAANHAQMPVLMPGGDCKLIDAEDLIHTCMTAATHLKFLSDWIVVRHSGIWSIGDFFELASEATLWPGLTLWVGFIIKDFSKKS